MTATAERPTGLLRRNRAFRLLWYGETVSQLGDRVSDLVLPLIAVTLLGAGPGRVGMLTALLWAPNLLGLFVGAWVDRRRYRRRLLIAADLTRAALLATLPLAYLAHALTLTQLYVVALGTGGAAVLFGVAYPAFFVALVPRESYLSATGLLSTSRAGSQVVGPALGGALVQVLTAPVAVLADALSFVASAVLLSRITDAPTVPARGPAWRQAADGITLVLRHPVLRACLGCVTTVNLCTFVGYALVVLYASRTLRLSAGTIGLAFGIGAVGAVAGAALAPWLSRRLGLGITAALGAALFPVPLAALALAGGPVLVRVAVLAGTEFVAGVGVMLLDVNLNALQADVTPDDARGRRAGAFAVVNYGSRPVGALLGGWLGTVLGLRPTLVLAGACGVLAAVWLLASPVRRVRTLDPA